MGRYEQRSRHELVKQLRDILASDVVEFMRSQGLDVDDPPKSDALFTQIVEMMCNEIAVVVYPNLSQDLTPDPMAGVSQDKSWEDLLEDWIIKLLEQTEQGSSASPADMAKVKKGIESLRNALDEVIESDEVRGTCHQRVIHYERRMNHDYCEVTGMS